MRIAIVGTGIAGNAAAWALAERHHITVYEQDRRPGGHSHTVEVDYDGARIAVDTGFIVYNEPNYPELTALFDHLGVDTVETDMSFSVSAGAGRFEWAGRGQTRLEMLDGLFAQRSNLASPSFFWMLREMQRFNRTGRADRSADVIGDCSLGSYLARHRYAARLVHDYLLPMGAAIWSTPAEQMLDFPAENFLAFFENHRLLHWQRPIWRTVRGGSKRYVEKLTASFRQQLRLGTPVVSIERTPRGVVVADRSGHRETYDHVVIAAHTDQALAMLADAATPERTVLGAIRYRPNTVFLHRDPHLMPKRKRAWASWNFLRANTDAQAKSDVAVTYWMNALQNIDASRPLFVSLNPPFDPSPELTFLCFVCEHPQFNTHAFAAQKALSAIQGTNRTWFCGAWTGYGFHEDGLRSGLAVAERLGAAIPWRIPNVFSEAAE